MGLSNRVPSRTIESSTNQFRLSVCRRRNIWNDEIDLRWAYVEEARNDVATRGSRAVDELRDQVNFNTGQRLWPRGRRRTS